MNLKENKPMSRTLGIETFVLRAGRVQSVVEDKNIQSGNVELLYPLI